MDIQLYSNGKKFSYGLSIEAEFFENYRVCESLYFSNIENGNLLEKEIEMKNGHWGLLKIRKGKLQLNKQPFSNSRLDYI